MIIVTRTDVTAEELDHIRERVEALGLRTHISAGESRTIVGCIGDEERLQNVPLLSIPGVEAVHAVMKPFKLAAREFSAGPSRIALGGGELGGREVPVIAGPCSVENVEMMERTAVAVRDAGARALRGGAFKPRTSPYSFQGKGEEGLKILAEVRRSTGLPVVTEVMDTRQVELVASYADVLQIGARNVQNYPLLKEIGATTTCPVMLKRGQSATITEFLLSAEYIVTNGNPRVILCERGIRTFESSTRNTLDINAVPVLNQLTHLPVILDPAHATGKRALIPPLVRAAVAVGADGVMVEIHPDPERAWSDGAQSMTFDQFAQTMAEIEPYVELWKAGRPELACVPA